MKGKDIYHEFIFEEDRPFSQCHASTLVVFDNGEVIAAWFGGSKEGADDVAIWCAKRKNEVWGSPIKVAAQEGIPHWNPVLFETNGTVNLYYKIGQTIPKWQTMVISSVDGGETWSKPAQLVKDDFGGRGPVKNKPIVLSNGAWVAPASIEHKIWQAFVDISYDNGTNWEKSMLVPFETKAGEGGLIQPTVWESKESEVHMMLRSSEGYIYRSDSLDYGRTWCQAYPTNLPNNNSGIDLACLQNGMLAIVYNPVGENWGSRTPLILSLSLDNGKTWGHDFVLENKEGEYSYPAIVSKGNDVYITYTWKRERIAFLKIGGMEKILRQP